MPMTLVERSGMGVPPAGGCGKGPARRVDEPGDAEVGEQRGVRSAGAQRALHVQQDVLGLDVAVHDPGGVRGGQRVGDVGGDGDRGLGGHPALALQAGAQVGAPYEVHHQRQVVAVDDEVAHADDAGVVQAQQRRTLLHEAADELLVGGEILTQQLDGHGPFGALAQPYRAGTAAPQDLVGGVPAADLPCQDCSDVSGPRASCRGLKLASKLRGYRGVQCPGRRQPSLLQVKSPAGSRQIHEVAHRGGPAAPVAGRYLERFCTKSSTVRKASPIWSK